MANKRISDLSSASTLTLNDLMVVVNEAQTRKMTIETFLNYLENLEQFATLDTNGKIPVEQIPATLLGAMKYQASWDASVNIPAIPAATSENAGWYYVVGTPGATNIDGISNWNTGDWVISNGVSWQKIDNTDMVTSWNTRTGAIVPQSGDYTTDLVTEGTSNKYYTAARVLAEILSGFSANNSAITASDSILTAFGKAQGQINAKENSTNKSQANGYASLDATGKVPLSEIPPSILGAAIYQASWNASTNSPTIPAASSSNKGWYYVVSVAGSTNVSGITDWKLGDWIISNGTAWEKVDNTDALISWNGRTGAVVPQSGDYTTSLVTEGTNKYYTAARVLAEVLAGFSPTNSAISASDSVVTAFGKAQGQINNREQTANKSVAGGYASLDGSGKVPVSELPSSVVGAVNYQNSWNASTNSPAIPTASSTNKGWYYVVSTAGSTSINGINDWKVGDWIISNGSVWQKVDNSESVTAWNSRTGNVVPQSGDYTTSLVTEGSNLYFTTARVLAAALSGFSANNAAITASDTILAAMGKAQGQINNRENTANKNAASGYAGLDSSSRVAPLNSMIGYNSLALDFTGYAASTTEQVVKAVQVNAGTFAAGDQINVDVWLSGSGNTGTKAITLYINTSSSKTGATLIGTYSTTANFGSAKFTREISFVTATSMKAGVAPATTTSLNGESASGMNNSATTIPNITSTFYLLVCLEKSSVSETFRAERIAMTGILNP